MADARKMVPFIKKWEGGWANDPDDTGGCTMSGITIGTYRTYFGRNKTCEDLRRITEDNWLYVFKRGYWDKMRADEINNQSIAQLCVDMGWGSGCKTAIKKIQAALGLEADGIIGPLTLGALNNPNSRRVFETLWNMRYEWFNQIAKRGNNAKFLKGWLRRLRDITYEP